MSRLMWRLVAGTVLTQTAIYVARPLLTYRAVDLGANEVGIGALVVAFTLCPALVALPLGRYCDRRSPIRVARGGVLLLILGATALAMAPTFGWLVIATTVLGLGSLAVMVAAQAEVARLLDRSQLDAGFGVLTTAVSVGQMVGPAVGGILIAGSDPGDSTTTGAFIVSACLCLLALRFLGFGMEGERPTPPGGARGTPWCRLLRRPTVAGGIVASAAILSAVDLLIAYLPLIGQRNGVDPAVIGLLLSARAAASVVSRSFIPALLRVASPGVLLVLSLMASGALLPTLAVARNPWILTAIMIAVGCFLGLGQPLTMSMLVRAVPAADQGAALSIRLSGTKVGQVTMAAAIAALTGVAGLSVALVVVGASLVFAAAAVVPRRA